MNSPDKKSPEPSMDDIISSIRSIIADDTQDSTPAPLSPPVENPTPAIVQLTENQIAEPASAQISASSPAINDTTPSLESASLPGKSLAQSLADAEVANEIDAVPGNLMSPDEPVASPAQTSPAAIATAPKLEISEPLAPANPIATPAVDSATNVAATLAPASAPITHEVVAQASASVQPVATPPSVPIDDIAFVAPEPTQILPTPIEQELVAQSVVPVAVANDPVEELMQSVDAGLQDGDLVNSEVDPDKILEGMDSEPAEQTMVAPLQEISSAIEEVVPSPVKEAAPVVLDASQVTPEDAVAITAVASATNQAMSDASGPEQTAEIEQKKNCNTLEDSVKQMLKPMIREWLDDNMPRILEGAVKDEVDDSGGNKT